MKNLLEKLAELEEKLRSFKYNRLLLLLPVIAVVLLLFLFYSLGTGSRYSIMRIANGLVGAAENSCQGEAFVTRIFYGKMVENEFEYNGVIPDLGYIAVDEHCNIAAAIYHNGLCAHKLMNDDKINIIEADHNSCRIETQIFDQLYIFEMIDEGYIPINSVADLLAIGSNVEHQFAEGRDYSIKVEANLDNKYFLINDIDMQGVEWQPIGSKQTPFTGIFDGNGFHIYNLNIRQREPEEPEEQTEDALPEEVDIGVGFFHTINDAVIENLQLTVNLEGENNIGSLAINATNSQIKKIKIKTTIKGEVYLGGVFANAIDTQISRTSVDITGVGTVHLGGFVAQASDLQIDNSSVTGSLKGEISVADFVAYLQNGKLINSYSLLDISADQRYFLVGKVGTDIEVIESYLGVSRGDDEYFHLRARLFSDLKKKETFRNWDFDSIWDIEENDYPKLR